MGLVNGAGNLGSLCVPHLTPGGTRQCKILTVRLQDWIIYMASQLGSGVPSVDDHRALQFRSLERLGFRYVGANPHPSVFRLGPTYAHACLVIRQMLIHENKRMDREEQELTGDQRERVEEAARLEGISFEEAVRRRRGFRYLY